MTFARIRHPEWVERTVGALAYARDIRPAGLLIGHVVRAPHPHARLLALDVTAARAAPGVVAVLTADMLPDRPYRDYYTHDRPALVGDRAVWFGQEVAVVAAETAAAAAAAAPLVRARWQPLPVVDTVAQALAPGAALVHPDRAPGNIATAADRRFGDQAAGTAAGLRSLRATYGCGAQTHACMEPHSALAHWDAGQGVMNLWTPTQAPRNVGAEVAWMLGLDPEAVRVHRVGVGGDFGARVRASDVEVPAAHLARITGRPVAIRLSRADEFAFAKRQHETTVELETWYDEAGLIRFRDAAVTVDNGAFIQGGSNQMNYCSILLASQYRVAGARVSGRSIYTNRRPGGAFRGAGGPQATFALECQMDEIAADLGRDPIDLRLANLNRAGDTTITGWEIGSCAAAECLAEVRRRLDWDARRAAGPGQGDRLRGVGVALAMHVSGAVVSPATAHAAATVEIGANGGVVLSTGCADPGTGEYAVMVQLVAHALGIAPERVELRAMDTATTPYDPGAGSSRATMITGTAVAEAAAALADRLRAGAAALLGGPADAVRLEAGEARIPGASVPLGAVAAAAGGVLSVTLDRVADTPVVPMTHADSGHGNLSPAYAFAAHGVEVEVDRATGAVRVLRVVAVHDAGTVINPAGAEGQVTGGVVMGLGAALGEQLLWHDGRPHVTGFVDYAMPRADSVPPIEVAFVGPPSPRGPHGAKSVSEIALMPIAAAVANAVAHATGVRLRALPLTPDKVLAALSPPRGPRPAPVWLRPRRWRAALVRRAYPRGLFALLHRDGGTPHAAPPPPVTALDRPADVAAAVAAVAAGAAPLGGGTDLLPARAQGLAGAPRLAALAGAGLDGWHEGADGSLTLGATVTLQDLAAGLTGSALPGDRALAEVAAGIATPQVRAMATLAGNLCQQNRCWFLRSGFDCYKRGGGARPCYAVTGDHRYFHAVIDAGRCQSVTPSDLATVLVALAAGVQVAGPAGRRTIPAGRFHTGPGETALRPGEIVTAVTIPAASRAAAARVGKLALTGDGFAIVSAAASLAASPDGRITGARIVLGGVAATPWRARAAEAALAGWSVARADAARAARAWAPAAHPLPGNAWKVDAAAGLLARVLAGALDDLATPRSGARDSARAATAPTPPTTHHHQGETP
jgi:CO/xanthine dehydrogenase Mo-binding subunit/CO/xanthine dehydrogenase FAD-binding subunit